MQSFPQPPSAKEEREYLKRCRAGDKDARNALIERNLRLVAYIAKKYASMDRDMEDLISIGTIGLIKAVDSFDESKGIRLASYASRCVENELLMNFRARKKTARDVYLYDTIGSDKEGNEISLIDIIEYEVKFRRCRSKDTVSSYLLFSVGCFQTHAKPNAAARLSITGSVISDSRVLRQTICTA